MFLLMFRDIGAVTPCKISFPFPFWAVELDDQGLLLVIGQLDSPGMVARLAGCLGFCCRLASLRLRDAASDGSSLVLYMEHVSFLKARSDIPRDRVILSRIARVSSVWSRSLANPCQ